jgi:hypothetical protein
MKQLNNLDGQYVERSFLRGSSLLKILEILRFTLKISPGCWHNLHNFQLVENMPRGENRIAIALF